MAVKTFTSERLTSSDVNTYLTNSGLVWIKDHTVAAGAASTTITSVFSSSFLAYRIVCNNIDTTAQSDLRLTMGNTTSNAGLWYGSLFYDNSNGAVTGYSRINGGNYAVIALSENAFGAVMSFDVHNPNVNNLKTLFHGTHFSRGLYSGWMGGNCNTNTSFTDFTITCGAGTLTGGVVRVFGYRQV